MLILCLFFSSSIKTYRYSKLSQGDSCENDPLDLSESLQGYHDDSDEVSDDISLHFIILSMMPSLIEREKYMYMIFINLIISCS